MSNFYDSIVFWFLWFAADNERLKQINPTISEWKFLLESIKSQFCHFLFPKFPSQTSAYNTVMYKFRVAEFAHTIQNPDVQILLNIIPLPAWPLLLWHHAIISFDMGLPFGSTIRCLHSLFKFDLSNLPPTLIIPSSSM